MSQNRTAFEIHCYLEMRDDSFSESSVQAAKIRERLIKAVNKAVNKEVEAFAKSADWRSESATNYGATVWVRG